MDLTIVWNLDITYIFSQIFVILSYTTLAATFAVRNRKALLILLLISVLSQAVTFFLLSAWSAFWMVGVALIRTVAYLIHDRVKGKTDKITVFDYSVFAFVIVSSIIVSIFTYDGFLSLFSVFGTAIYSFSICQKNIKVYRILGIPCEAIWVVYSIFISSALGILAESILLGFIIASAVFYSQIDKLKKEQTPTLIQDTVTTSDATPLNENKDE